MLKTVDFYYFSPTGGTEKVGKAISSSVAETVNAINLSDKAVRNPSSDVIVVAVPVFSGRIPAIVADKITALNGEGKKAITAVVYGVRAYEDALLELNNTVKNGGFEVIASAALVAQHSIVPEVGAGRPDKSDIEEIQQFANNILSAIEEGKTGNVTVPGNYPYKEVKKGSAIPISLANCNGCGHCASVCPTEAVTVTDNEVLTDADKCIMCMACVAKCPAQFRVLPPPIQEALTQKLSIFKEVHRENEFYL